MSVTSGVHRLHVCHQWCLLFAYLSPVVSTACTSVTSGVYCLLACLSPVVSTVCISVTSGVYRLHVCHQWCLPLACLSPVVSTVCISATSGVYRLHVCHQWYPPIVMCSPPLVLQGEPGQHVLQRTWSGEGLGQSKGIVQSCFCYQRKR